MRSKKAALLLFLLCFSCISGFFADKLAKENERVGEVINVDNSRLITRGVASVGEQRIEIEIDKLGKYWLPNFVKGDREYDEVYQKGDKVVAGLIIKDGRVEGGRILSLYRLPYLKILFIIFSSALILYSNSMGIKSLLSFFLSIFIIIKYMVPAFLNGTNPFTVALFTIILLTFVIIFSIGGLTIKGLSAFLGTVTGLLISIFLSYFFIKFLKLDGFTMPMSQGLLLGGRFNLDFQKIYFASIILSASGAAMDIAMDMAASIEELIENNPKIPNKALLKSSFNIGNAVVGTMSTTLLLAYSGGNITLMMFLMDRNISPYSTINGKIIGAEITRTLVGTISLIIVAPSTALISIGIRKLIKKSENKKNKKHYSSDFI